MRKICNLLLTIFVFLLLSCSSIPKFSGKAKLCCFLIDENDYPIKNCLGELRKNNIVIGKSYSNDKGLLVFDDTDSGKYEISFSKIGYEEKTYTDVFFIDKGKVFCFKLNSAKEIINKVNVLYSEKKFNEGLSLLNKINFEKNTSLDLLITTYNTYGFLELNDKKSATKEFSKIKKKIKKVKDKDYELFILEKKLEEL